MQASDSDLSSDRSLSPYQTLAKMRPRMGEFGITRLADQTGLDFLGTPTFAAFRPNAATIAVNQGKGSSLAAAEVSALMEAVEFSVAEQPLVETTQFATLGDAECRGFVPDIGYLLPYGQDWSPSPETLWVTGRCWLNGGNALAPIDAVNLWPRAQSISNICKNTNGLASGNTAEEAYFHALCELIERDAESLWSLSQPEFLMKGRVRPSRLQSDRIDQWCDVIARNGLELSLVDMTSDIDVPAYACIISDATSGCVASGTGAHPLPARAAMRAIVEAAQSRVTAIAGARDDIESAWTEPGTQPVLDLREADRPGDPTSRALAMPGMRLADLIGVVEGALREAGVANVASFPLVNDPDFAVIKVLASDLEDRAPNVHWRPRTRALEVLAA